MIRKALAALAMVAATVGVTQTAHADPRYGNVRSTPNRHHPTCIVQTITGQRWAHDGDHQSVYTSKDAHEHCFENSRFRSNWMSDKGLHGLATFWGRSYYRGWNVVIVTSQRSIRADHNHGVIAAMVPKLPGNNPWSNMLQSGKWLGAFYRGCWQQSDYLYLFTGGSFNGTESAIDIYRYALKPDLGRQDNDLDSFFFDC